MKRSSKDVLISRELIVGVLLGAIIATVLTFLALKTFGAQAEQMSREGGVVSLILTALAALAEGAVAWFIYLELKHGRRSEVISATNDLYQEWWSGEMRDHRTALKRFIDSDRADRMSKKHTMKDVNHNETIEAEKTGSKGSVVKLVHFFDRVGWLGAAELIDVDYVLGPMEHIMRRTWVTMADFMTTERDSRQQKGDRLDPVYNYGFEWLYRYSCEKNHDQASLMAGT